MLTWGILPGKIFYLFHLQAIVELYYVVAPSLTLSGKALVLGQDCRFSGKSNLFDGELLSGTTPHSPHWLLGHIFAYAGQA